MWPWAVTAVLLGALSGAIAFRGEPGTVLLAIELILVALVAVGSVWRLEVGLVALVFTLPLDAFGRLPVLPATVTLYQLMLLVVLAAWGVRIIAEGREWLRFSAIDLGAGSVMLAALWSLPNSLAPAATVTAMGRLVFLWLFELLYANGIRTARVMRLVTGAFLASAVVIGALAIAQQWLGFDLGAVTVYRAAGGGVNFSRAGAFFEDPNHLGTVVSIAFVMSAAFLVRVSSMRAAWPHLLVIAVTGLALLASLSRTAWVGAALGVVLVVATAPRQRRLALAGAVATAGLIAVLFASPLLVSRALSVGDVGGDRSVATRYYMTQSTLAMIKDNPIWGTGLDAFPKAYPPYRIPGANPTIVELHQLPLAFPVEMGLAGILAELVLFGSVIALFVHKHPSGWTVFEAAAVAAVATMLVQTFFQYYLYFEHLWFVLAYAVAASRLARTGEEETG